MSSTENLVNASPYSRSNAVGYDERPQSGFNNAGAGITATLTRNIFNRSFPDWEEEAKLFSTFFWAPIQVIGAGVKNIQWGTKETETFVEYKVGDLIALKIKNRPKVYESRIGDLKIKIQCSLDFPPHWHVDKFIDVGEYEQFTSQYKAQLGQSMSKTMYELFRFFFISSAYGACLPQNEYNKLLLKTLIQTDPLPLASMAARPFENEVPIYSPLMMFIINHRDHFKALSDEMNRKISNIWVFDTQDVIYTSRGTRFNPYNPWFMERNKEIDAIQRLAKCLTPSDGAPAIPSVDISTGADLNRQWRMSREKSLKAFEIVLNTIAREVERPNHIWWQGNCGNTYKSSESNWNSADAPAVLYPNDKGTTIMNKAMNERPMLTVVCKKENKILVMARSDYDDFTSGSYKGYFGSETMAELNWPSVAAQFSEIIPIDGMPAGHALILDKRMIACIPHLETSGTDTIAQRLVSMSTMHKWLIFGLFDQFVGVRIQMTGYTATPTDMSNIFFNEKDVKLYTAQHGRDARQ